MFTDLDDLETLIVDYDTTDPAQIYADAVVRKLSRPMPLALPAPREVETFVDEQPDLSLEEIRALLPAGWECSGERDGKGRLSATCSYLGAIEAPTGRLVVLGVDAVNSEGILPAGVRWNRRKKQHKKSKLLRCRSCAHLEFDRPDRLREHAINAHKFNPPDDWSDDVMRSALYKTPEKIGDVEDATELLASRDAAERAAKKGSARGR